MIKNEVVKISPILTKIAIVLGALLFVLVIYFLVRTTPEKYYAKASRQHKKGEKRYLKGHFDLADLSYNKAEELRKRARELE